eukprot:5893533-Prymnesium_polylepis.1
MGCAHMQHNDNHAQRPCGMMMHRGQVRIAVCVQWASRTYEREYRLMDLCRPPQTARTAPRAALQC